MSDELQEANVSRDCPIQYSPRTASWSTTKRMLMNATNSDGVGQALIDRRAFLRASAATLPLLYLTNGRVQGTGAADRPAKGDAFPGLILRDMEPLNLEFPFATLDSFITPNER